MAKAVAKAEQQAAKANLKRKELVEDPIEQFEENIPEIVSVSVCHRQKQQRTRAQKVKDDAKDPDGDAVRSLNYIR